MYRTATAALETDTGLSLSAEYTYDNDLLTSIKTASTTYNFTYGNFALRGSVAVGNKILASYDYQDGTNWLERLDYGNDDYVEYTYDDQGRVTRQDYESGAYVTYHYDNNGALAKVYDSQTDTTSTYYYDFTDRMMKYVEKSSTGTHSVGYEYDSINNLTALVETINGVERKTSYTYDKDNRPTSVIAGNSTLNYGYDKLGRVSSLTTKHNNNPFATKTYSYKLNADGKPTNQVSSVTIQIGSNSQTFTYTYDQNGNIISISDGTYTTSYAYDSANQLIREDNQEANTITLWTYDDAGNILSRTVRPYVPGTEDEETQTNYYYTDTQWGDLLKSYNSRPIMRDEIGNPTNDFVWRYTWQHGRQLASMNKLDGSAQWNYTYNADGLRTQRTGFATDSTTGVTANRTYNYTYLGGQLTHMTVDGHTMYFTYDAAGTPMSLTYDGVTYYYVTNLQGDVVAILNSSGAEVVSYSYDAWGNLISTDCDEEFADLGFYNPLRYRGYVYDPETKLYYLQSRYYNPEMGRFINADAFASTGQGLLGNNVFAYCNNNPIMMIDENGNCPHNGRFYTSGPFKDQFEYDPNCDLCYSHTEYWVHDAYGNWYNLWQHEVHEFDQMAICTDGGDNSYNSNSHQNKTAYSIKNEYMEPTRIKYVVAPVGYNNVKNGDLALVIDRTTGNSLFAIVGDRGPKGKYNEVSLCVAWDLGYSWADGSRGPKGDFQIVYFPNTNRKWKSLNELENFLN